MVSLCISWLFGNSAIFKKNCELLHKVITTIGALTFGIYLMDPVLKVVGKYFDLVVTTPDPILYSIIWCLFSMTVCGIVTYILKKIPGIKKLL